MKPSRVAQWIFVWGRNRAGCLVAVAPLVFPQAHLMEILMLPLKQALLAVPSNRSRRPLFTGSMESPGVIVSFALPPHTLHALGQALSQAQNFLLPAPPSKLTATEWAKRFDKAICPMAIALPPLLLQPQPPMVKFKFATTRSKPKFMPFAACRRPQMMEITVLGARTLPNAAAVILFALLNGTANASPGMFCAAVSVGSLIAKLLPGQQVKKAH